MKYLGGSHHGDDVPSAYQNQEAVALSIKKQRRANFDPTSPYTNLTSLDDRVEHYRKIYFHADAGTVEAHFYHLTSMQECEALFHQMLAARKTVPALTEEEWRLVCQALRAAPFDMGRQETAYRLASRIYGAFA